MIRDSGLSWNPNRTPKRIPHRSSCVVSGVRSQISETHKDLDRLGLGPTSEVHG